MQEGRLWKGSVRRRKAGFNSYSVWMDSASLHAGQKNNPEYALHLHLPFSDITLIMQLQC